MKLNLLYNLQSSERVSSNRATENYFLMFIFTAINVSEKIIKTEKRISTHKIQNGWCCFYPSVNRAGVSHARQIIINYLIIS